MAQKAGAETEKCLGDVAPVTVIIIQHSDTREAKVEFMKEIRSMVFKWMKGVLLLAVSNIVLGTFTIAHARPLLAGVGNCTGERGSVEMSRIMFLENRMLEADMAGERILITLIGQRIRIESLPTNNAGTVYVVDIGDAVSIDEYTADVELRLAVLDNKPVLYWKETFMHRIYRQGNLGSEVAISQIFVKGEGVPKPPIRIHYGDMA